jgi:hypothetical protein
MAMEFLRKTTSQNKFINAWRYTMGLLKKLVHRSFNTLGFDIRRFYPPPSHKPPPEFILPKIPASTILNGNIPIRILEPEAAQGNVTLLELLVLNTLVARLSPDILFEIGTFDGRTTLNITSNTNPGAKTFTLDLPREELSNTAFALDRHDIEYVDKQVSGIRFSNKPWQKQIMQLFGDSAKFDFLPYHGKCGIVFIDGSHAYDYVKSDTKVALRLIVNPAIIVWHDYQSCWPDVVKYLGELYLSGGVFAGLKHVEGTSLAILPLGTSI